MENRQVIIGAGVLLALYIFRDQVKSLMINTTDALNNRNVRAFLALIRKYESYESAGKYDVIYGGRTFADFSAHPNIRTPFFNPKTQKNDYSTAAGAYQITRPTWSMIQAATGLKDFTPASQDAAAVWLLKYCGALDFVVRGDILNALNKASGTWASLPFSTSMQAKITTQNAIAAYTSAGGQIA